MDKSFCDTPQPLPAGAVLVGPFHSPVPVEDEGEPVRIFECAAEAMTWLSAAESDSSSVSGGSRLLLLHQDAFVGREGIEDLSSWLGELRRSGPSFLPILLHGHLPGGLLVRFFRAGLHDALALPLDRIEWVNLLLRTEKQLARREQSRLILSRRGETQEMLRNLRKELEGEVVESTGELLRAQETLEAANRQLTDAMAELSLLYRFGRELSAARNWDQVLREILQNLSDFVGAGGAALILRSSPGGSYSPRQTWHWEEGSWDQVLVNLQDQVDDAVAESIMAPGVFHVDSDPGAEAGATGRVVALPLEHKEARLGFLLLLFRVTADREAASARFLPFLQAVQVVLSEEVAGAQMLDRIRDIGSFNAQVLETVRSAIWVLDESGATVFCNRAAQELMTGQAPRQLDPEEFLFRIGRGRRGPTENAADEDWPELLLDARLDLEGLDGVLPRLLRDRPAGSFRGEGQIRRSDGVGIPVLVQTALMPGGAREEEWLVVVAEDLRETRKLEAERIRADRLEGLVEMSATLAHEIRNPLMGLSAQAELLSDQLAADDPRARYIEVITGEVDRINNTITRLLNFVRPYEPEYQERSLLRLILDSLDLVRPRAEDKEASLELTPADPADREWDLRMDADQIKQVLLNLLINAIDAAPRGGIVKVRLQPAADFEFANGARGTRQRGPGVVCEVIDGGAGFKDGDLEKIFRPFFTTKSSGTGLGLSICHKIVAAHGGEITAGRRNGETVFRVLLPRRTTAAEASG